MRYGRNNMPPPRRLRILRPRCGPIQPRTRGMCHNQQSLLSRAIHRLHRCPRSLDLPDPRVPLLLARIQHPLHPNQLRLLQRSSNRAARDPLHRRPLRILPGPLHRRGRSFPHLSTVLARENPSLRRPAHLLRIRGATRGRPRTPSPAALLHRARIRHQGHRRRSRTHSSNTGLRSASRVDRRTPAGALRDRTAAAE